MNKGCGCDERVLDGCRVGNLKTCGELSDRVVHLKYSTLKERKDLSLQPSPKNDALCRVSSLTSKDTDLDFIDRGRTDELNLGFSSQGPRDQVRIGFTGFSLTQIRNNIGV